MNEGVKRLWKRSFGGRKIFTCIELPSMGGLFDECLELFDNSINPAHAIWLVHAVIFKYTQRMPTKKAKANHPCMGERKCDGNGDGLKRDRERGRQ